MLIQHRQIKGKGLFFVEVDGNILAEMVYTMASPEKMIIEHTEVSEELKGKNVGYELLDTSVEYARTKNIKIIPLCPFASSVFKKETGVRRRVKLMYKSLTIATFAILIIFTQCKNQARGVEQIALNISTNLDINSLNLLKNYNYIQRGDFGFWQRISSDSILYSCSYKTNKDTIELTVFSPFNFLKDFASTFNFDTSDYFKFTFSEKQQTISRITLTDKHGRDHSFDTSVLTNKLFPKRNPYTQFSSLTVLKDKFGFIETSYRSDIGDFIVFWISPQHKLTYMPDTTNLNPRSKRYWLDEFYKGKKIKEHWSLIKVYD